MIPSYKLWEISEKVPVLVEIIDETGKINAFYEQISPYLESMRYRCLVTSEKVEVILYKPRNRNN